MHHSFLSMIMSVCVLANAVSAQSSNAPNNSNDPSQGRQTEKASSQDEQLYPNELDGYKLYEKHCLGLRPGHATEADTNRLFGEQKEHSWERQRIYEKDSWNIYVGFYYDDGCTPKYLWGKVESIAFVPKEKISFKNQKFSTAFIKQRVYACVTWNDYRDAHGLIYSVYDGGALSFSTGKRIPANGNLNRISYRLPPHVEANVKHFLLRDYRDAQKTQKETEQKTREEMEKNLRQKISQEIETKIRSLLQKEPEPGNPFE